MTRDEAIHKLVALAYDQVGYKEGANNWNKYAADPRMKELYGWDVQNQPWCAIYVNWLFIDDFGFADGTSMTYGGSPACSLSAQLYKNHNAWSMNPRKGDQVFFYVNGGINHTGVVVDVSGSTITTIEGNTSDSVAVRTYYSGDSTIAGYGVPNWSVVADVPDEDPDEDTGLVVDGECGEQTWSAIAKRMPDVSKLPLVKKGSHSWDVEFLQVMMNYFGAKLKVDGEFGSLTETAVKQFQSGQLKEGR